MVIKDVSFAIDDIDIKYNNKWIDFRKKLEKKISGDVNIKIGAWNMQSLNKNINNRYTKLEFLRDILTDNQLDIVYLIDVNDKSAVFLNGYKKYEDDRNVLLVKDEIMDEFIVSQNCIFSVKNKLAFVYIIPESRDVVLLNNFCTLLKHKFTIIGDVNYKSNKILHNRIKHFAGEDTLQTGVITLKNCRVDSVAAPSDHRFIIIHIKIFANLLRSLKVGEISYSESREKIFSILNGVTPKFCPKVIIKQYRIGLNDREKTINAMVDEYLNNNVRKIFQRYNFLWCYDRREPFLGKRVPDSVKNSYAKHLREDKNKKYIKIEDVVNVDKVWIENITVKNTKSRAVNHEFISLCNITKAVNEFIVNEKNCNVDIVNNMIKVANECMFSLNAEVFFLQKNRSIKDFSDVRVIMVVPTLIKMFECVIFNRVTSYLSEFIGRSNYQFGGIIGGSTYQAMLKIKKLQSLPDSGGIILFDMSKGYDTVNLSILESCFNRLYDDNVKALLLVWLKMVSNLDVVVNNEKILRTRGIPMGLSLSPIVFVLYVHYALYNIKKDKMAVYIDDIAMVLDKEAFKQNLYDIEKVIKALADFELVINEKKSMFESKNKGTIEVLEKRFSRFDSAKYLGRNIIVNGDGKVVPDDRFVNLKGNRVMGLVYYATFFVKRLVYNAALDAKLRYKLLMWSTSDKVIRKALWVSHWSFFRKTMFIYSYVQVCFTIFNAFRYFIDITDVLKWREWLVKKKKSQEQLKELIVDKLVTGLDQIDVPIKAMNIDFKLWRTDSSDEIAFTRMILDSIWNEFKHQVVINYKNKKLLEDKKNFYENLEEFCKSKLFKGFGILQAIAFNHFNQFNNKNRTKDVFLIFSLFALFRAINDSIAKVVYDKADIRIVPDFNFDLIFNNYIFEIDEEEFKEWNIDRWNRWKNNKVEQLWHLLDKILEILEISKLKGWTDPMNIMNEINKFEYVAFVDGAYNEKKNITGYGWLIQNVKTGKLIEEDKGTIVDKSLLKLKNVAGELMATAEAIDRAVEVNLEELCIVYDYLGIVKYVSGEWTSKDPFIKQYIIRVKQMMEFVNIKFIKVASHTGVKGNERADFLAKQGAEISTISSNDKPKYAQSVIDYLKDKFKVVFKFLTVIELCYYNNNLNGLSLEWLLVNMKVKIINLDEFLEKNYRLFMLERHLDPIEDKIYD